MRTRTTAANSGLDFDEDAFVEDFDFLARMGLDRVQIADRMEVTKDCLDGRIQRAVRRSKMARLSERLLARYPAGYVAAIRPHGFPKPVA